MAKAHHPGWVWNLAGEIGGLLAQSRQTLPAHWKLVEDTPHVIDVLLIHPFQLGEQDVMRMSHKESDLGQIRELMSSCPFPPSGRGTKSLWSPNLDVGTVAVVVPGQLTHQRFHGFAAFGGSTPDIHISGRGRIAQKESESGASKHDHFAPAYQARSVGHDVRDLGRIDHWSRSGKGWDASTPCSGGEPGHSVRFPPAASQSASGPVPSRASSQSRSMSGRTDGCVSSQRRAR